jgi:hypothetical protein
MAQPSPFEFPDEYATRVGHLVLRWSVIDTILQFIIWKLANLPEREAYLFTGRLDARPKWEVITELVLHRPHLGIFAELWGVIRKKLPRAQKDRNDAAHAFWFSDPGQKDAVFLADMRPAGTGQLSPAQQANLKELDRQLARSQSLLDALLEAMRHIEPPPSPEKPV